MARNECLACNLGSTTLWKDANVEVVTLEEGKRTVMQVSAVLGVGDTFAEGGMKGWSSKCASLGSKSC